MGWLLNYVYTTCTLTPSYEGGAHTLAPPSYKEGKCPNSAVVVFLTFPVRNRNSSCCVR
jgi:hypothetical protein